MAKYAETGELRYRTRLRQMMSSIDRAVDDGLTDRMIVAATIEAMAQARVAPPEAARIMGAVVRHLKRDRRPGPDGGCRRRGRRVGP